MVGVVGLGRLGPPGAYRMTFASATMKFLARGDGHASWGVAKI